MREQTRRRRIPPAIWALLAMLGVPTLAQAQLFPNASIHRKRPPCCQEPPVYKTYREQYYGYFPTCWRRFPPGWGCPTPEAPPPWDLVQRDEPVRSDRDVQVPSVDATLPGSGEARGAPELPLPPDTTSPFEMPGDRPGTENPPRGPNAPQAPAPSDSPFDLPPQGSTIEVPSGNVGLPELPPLGDGIGAVSEPSFEPVAGAFPTPAPGPTTELTTPMPPVVNAPPVIDEILPGDGTRYQAPRRGVLAGMLDRIKIRRR